MSIFHCIMYSARAIYLGLDAKNNFYRLIAKAIVSALPTAIPALVPSPLNSLYKSQDIARHQKMLMAGVLFIFYPLYKVGEQGFYTQKIRDCGSLISQLFSLYIISNCLYAWRGAKYNGSLFGKYVVYQLRLSYQSFMNYVNEHPQYNEAIAEPDYGPSFDSLETIHIQQSKVAEERLEEWKIFKQAALALRAEVQIELLDQQDRLPLTEDIFFRQKLYVPIVHQIAEDIKQHIPQQYTLSCLNELEDLLADLNSSKADVVAGKKDLSLIVANSQGCRQQQFTPFFTRMRHQYLQIEQDDISNLQHATLNPS